MHFVHSCASLRCAFARESRSLFVVLCDVFRIAVRYTRSRTASHMQKHRGPAGEGALLLSYQALILLCESQYHLSLSSLLSFFAATNYNLKGERRKKKHKLPEKAKIKHQQQMISKSCSRLSPPNFPSFPLIN
jgi:hypothetical protein